LIAQLVDIVESGPPPSPARHPLFAEGVAAPIAFCSSAGELETGTPMALSLLRRLRVLERAPSPLPAELWRLLDQTPPGEAVEWRPPEAGRSLLGCTRYAVEWGGFLLLMREVSDKHAALSERLHRQRLESTGRLVASIAHDIRSSVASIVYSADFLDVSGPAVSEVTLRETVQEICDASRRLQLTVDGLLDYARLGPTIAVPVSLCEVMNRAQGLLRSFYRSGSHRLCVEIAQEADWVRGNPIVIEQIFVNLLINAAECSSDPRLVVVSSSIEDLPGSSRSSGPSHVCVRVADDGPGVARTLRDSIFEPFFTTKSNGTGLGLPTAREAAESQQGGLVLEEASRGATFAVFLPRSEGPR
jgi:two-component system sensor histidine kinase FlrB